MCSLYALYLSLSVAIPVIQPRLRLSGTNRLRSAFHGGQRMQIKTILNQIQKFKSFVYGTVRLVEDAPVPTLEIEIQPRSNSCPICSGCGHKRPGYDRSPERLFEFIPMWGYKVFFRFAPCRVDCPDCGVRVERMHWVVGKHRLIEAYVWYLVSER
ncbi:MAG: hypothetical protein KZQ60_05305 [Candidatus Thiodiazotropha sp. (ex Lucinoma aequizonata)]|nr:hypothetical protein [Candidatus Thiodiazotropha sp. (ex Lucinoma aequizonata)]